MCTVLLPPRGNPIAVKYIISQILGPTAPWWWENYGASKHQVQITGWCSVISKRTKSSDSLKVMFLFHTAHSETRLTLFPKIYHILKGLNSPYFEKSMDILSYYTATTKYFLLPLLLNLLMPELFFLILAHSVNKMWIIQEPNKLELWNKLHFKEKKTESIHHV